MKIVTPKPITNIAGNRAVLLLHGFTGSTVDVRRLAKYLHNRGYTCHAPLYKGHGGKPEQLIHTSPEDWWQDVISGYDFLKSKGYERIAVVGVSLGGVFSLKLGMKRPVTGIATMSAPAKEKSVEDLKKRVLDYATGYKKLEGKNPAEIHVELSQLEQSLPTTSLKGLQQFILTTSEKLTSITTPTFILQGCLDEQLYHESAKLIFERIHTEEKQLKWYKNSGHIMTLGDEREKIHHDIAAYLESLDW
ncbi:alpha/beta hydrolase [Alkalibacillus aidingensis]|uniref:alpha/beta hydrolase n=1 Tax=Alkalibacillus aidingensis TaxID=2747607 RepID=UPI0016600BFF|nr:alpha/beta fold hydrolase [Alkalibacillus aidingensis]